MSVFTPLMTLVLICAGQVQTGRIIGGHEAKPHSRPYMVLVILQNDTGSIDHCGGFLVNEEFVMTAAHCKADSYTVQLGVHDASVTNGIQIRSVTKLFPHEDFNYTTENDIMLLKLNSKVQFSRNVSPIVLASTGSRFPRSCSVSGWGSTSQSGGHMSWHLMEVDVSLQNKPSRIPHMYWSSGTTGPGKGDSGGPLVCEGGQAYGVVSNKYSPCVGDPTDYFVKIPDYRAWADRIMRSK